MVAFADEPVGPAVLRIKADFNGSAHVVVSNEQTRELAVITLTNQPNSPHQSVEADLLAGSMTFGTLLHWLRDCHDGQTPIRFIVNHENVGATEAPLDPSMRKLADA